MVNPFDLKTVLLAKDAQHVVLIHFPIALFITAAVFDLIAQWTKRRSLADGAYYNLLVAAVSTVPVLATGLLAWRFQLEGQKLKGILLMYLVFACFSTVMIWVVWWVHCSGSWSDRPDRPFGWLSKWRQCSWLVPDMSRRKDLRTRPDFPICGLGLRKS